jgi:hypothetical protein
VVSGCIAAAELVSLAAIFSILGLHGGLWAIPAFTPLLLWMGGCALAGRTLRPVALSRLQGGGRVAAAAVALVVFLVLWSAWSPMALAAWHGDHGGLQVGGYGGGFHDVPSLRGFPTEAGGGLSLPRLPDPFPRFPYGAVLAASPVLLCVVWSALVVLGMIAMPGRSMDGEKDGERGRGGSADARRGEAGLVFDRRLVTPAEARSEERGEQ